MDDQERRLRVSLRLKAARYLAGQRSGKDTAVGKTIAELAEDPLLRANGIRKNRLDEIEQMKVTARPMELEKIAQALGVPATWFEADPAAPSGETDGVSQRLDQLSQAIDDLASLTAAVQADVRDIHTVLRPPGEEPGHRRSS